MFFVLAFGQSDSRLGQKKAIHLFSSQRQTGKTGLEKTVRETQKCKHFGLDRRLSRPFSKNLDSRKGRDAHSMAHWRLEKMLRLACLCSPWRRPNLFLCRKKATSLLKPIRGQEIERDIRK